MRCDLCLIYRPNVAKEDRRMEICSAWKKIWKGFDPDPKQRYVMVVVQVTMGYCLVHRAKHENV